MKKIKVISNQSILDIAIQELGNVDAAFDLALYNDISITEVLVPGQELKIPTSEFIKTDVFNYFFGKQRKIATSQTFPSQGDLSPNVGGIGYMEIEETFIVS